MKSWAEKFYHSGAWKNTSKKYKVFRNGICERCGMPAKIIHHKKYLTEQNINDPNITLNFNNLEALCQDCHNREHHREESKKRYIYDEDGNILPPPSK